MHAPTQPRTLDRLPAPPAPDRARLHTAAPAQTARVPLPSRAAHDFLVPNPRPDLTLDPHLLRMIEVR